MSLVWEFIGVWKQQYYAMIRIQFPEFFRSVILVIYGFVTALPIHKSNRIANESKNKDDPTIDRVDCEVLYDPPPGTRKGDIIIIHGLHGSTSKTWRQGVYENSKVKKIELRRHLSLVPKAVEKLTCPHCKCLKRSFSKYQLNRKGIDNYLNKTESVDSDYDLPPESGSNDYNISFQTTVTDRIDEKTNRFDIKNGYYPEQRSSFSTDFLLSNNMYDNASNEDSSFIQFSSNINFNDNLSDTSVLSHNGIDNLGDNYSQLMLNDFVLNQLNPRSIPDNICDSNLALENNFYNNGFNLFNDDGFIEKCDSYKENFKYMDLEKNKDGCSNTIKELKSHNNFKTFVNMIDRESQMTEKGMDLNGKFRRYNSEIDIQNKDDKNQNTDENVYCVCENEKIEISTGYVDKRLYEKHLKCHIYGNGSLLIREFIFYFKFLLNFAKQLYSIYRKLWDVPDDKKLSNCWPRDWLPIDCPYTRVISINYTTFLWMPIWSKSCDRTSLQEKSLDMAKKLEGLGVGKLPIVWAAHSKGGLFIKQMFINSWRGYGGVSRDLFSNTHTIVFYSVPHHGSVLAHFFTPPIVRPSVEIIEIRTGSQMVSKLHSEFREALEAAHEREYLNAQPCVVSYTETIPTNMAGVLLQIVFPMSADPGVGEFYGIPLDHRMICKFASRECLLYKDLIKIIKQACKTELLS